jgi:hypothetical protein
MAAARIGIDGSKSAGAISSNGLLSQRHGPGICSGDFAGYMEGRSSPPTGHFPARRAAARCAAGSRASG